MDNNALRVLKINYLLAMSIEEIDFLDKKETQPIVFQKIKKIKDNILNFQLDLKTRLAPNKYDEIFDSFTTDKKFAIMSILYKLIAMDESQVQELENMIELKD